MIREGKEQVHNQQWEEDAIPVFHVTHILNF